MHRGKEWREECSYPSSEKPGEEGCPGSKRRGAELAERQRKGRTLREDALLVEQREEAAAAGGQQLYHLGVGHDLGVVLVARQPLGVVLLLRGCEDDLIEDRLRGK